MAFAAFDEYLDPALTTGEVIIRPASLPADWEALQRLSPPKMKNPAEFFTYATLVAEVHGEVAGYHQFCLTPADKVLHSFAFRIGAKWKGQGIGQKLADAKVEIAKAAGARMHMYAVDAHNEPALKKICDKQGMHACQQHGPTIIYVQGFGDAG